MNAATNKKDLQYSHNSIFFQRQQQQQQQERNKNKNQKNYMVIIWTSQPRQN